MEEINKLAVNERIRYLRECLEISRDEFAIKLGIKAGQLANIENKRQKAPAWYLETINNKWPQHTYWIATGIEIPEQGHVKPKKRLKEDFIEEKLKEHISDTYT